MLDFDPGIVQKRRDLCLPERLLRSYLLTYHPWTGLIVLRTLFITICLILPAPVHADDGLAFFEARIRPVLVEHCHACHSAKAAEAGKLKGGLRVDHREGLRKGGDSGPAVVPGQPEKGTLLASLRHTGDTHMPPKGKLPEAIAADMERWIRMGAVDPRDEKSTTNTVTTGLPWSFTPPRATGTESPGEIDRFIQAKLSENKLVQLESADKRTLIRRIYFDLIGLPPTPEDVSAFVADTRPTAYAELVDRLLASPRHGERMARHWLDVARYAEDQAHTFAVTPKRNAYRYRDWVIAAMNNDMPFDQFVRFQLAGDFMPESSGDTFTRLAGLGIIGLGADYYKNTAREQAIADELDDRVDTVTRGFLGLTISCARCHDHKFDPVSQIDYYALAGIFNGFSNVDVPLAKPDVVKAFDSAQKAIKEAEGTVNREMARLADQATSAALPRLADYLTASRRLILANSVGNTKAIESEARSSGLSAFFLGRWARFLNSGSVEKIAELKEFKALKADARPEAIAAACTTFINAVTAASTGAKPSEHPLMKTLKSDKAGPFFATPEEVEKHLASDGDKKGLAEMRADIDRLKKASPPMYPVAHSIRGGGQTMPLYIRGNVLKKGAPAPKGFPVTLSAPSSKRGEAYTRLDLAEAIASRNNPLTARVIVNRVWERHFGKGLVGTPSNFGHLGDKPTHPELLDTLAVRFMDHGWSLKWLHRTIVNSKAYQASSGPHAANEAIDPANVWLWRANRRRLDVEVWRDSLLSVSGVLDLTEGGPTFDLRDAASNRRTVYAKVSRHNLDGLLRLFDFPDANVTSDRRTVTTVPQQQLFALNSEFMARQSAALASRLAREATTETDQIRLGFRLAYGRDPMERETRLSLAFLALPANKDDKLNRREQFAQALLAANEFMYVD